MGAIGDQISDLRIFLRLQALSNMLIFFISANISSFEITIYACSIKFNTQGEKTYLHLISIFYLKDKHINNI